MKLFERNPCKRLGWELTFDPVLAVLWIMISSAALLFAVFGLGCVLYWLGWWT